MMIQTGTVARGDLRSGAGGTRYLALDAWRGAAALMVAFFHAPILHAATGARWFANLEMAVDFFFVLSGFVICHAYGGRLRSGAQARGFLIRRFGRIWPLHAAVLAAFVALEAAKAVAQRAGVALEHAPFSGDFSPALLLSNLLFTQAFDLHGMTSWNFPAWSVAVEFYAYAAFALVILLAGARISVFLALAIGAAAALAALSPRALIATHDFGFFRCLFGFFLGCAVQRVVAKGRMTLRDPAATTLEIAIVAAVAGFLCFAREDATSFAAPFLFAAAVLVFSCEGGAVSRAMRRRAPQALGRWSYSIYMVHALAFAGFAMAAQLALRAGLIDAHMLRRESERLWTIDGSAATWGVMLALLACIVATAALSYRFIEDPARRAFNRMAANPGAQQSAEGFQEHREAERTFRPGAVA